MLPSLEAQLRGSSGRLEHHLRPTIIPCIEVLVGIWAFGQFQTMGNDMRGLGAPMMDKLCQAAIVGLYIRLTCPDLLALEPERTEVEGHLALLRQFVFRSRILWHEHSNHAYATSGLG